jgi:hypothetical protein
MAEIFISDLTEFTGDTSNGWVIFNNSDESETYKLLIKNVSLLKYSKDDTLWGGLQRTLFSSTEPKQYTGTTSVDLLELTNFYGSRELPYTFFENSLNFNNKIIYFRVTGVFGSGNSTFNSYLMIGSDKLIYSDIGDISLNQLNTHTFEILGEIIINQGEAIVLYSLAYCDNSGTFRRYLLSSGSKQNISTFSGGDIKLMINSTTTETITTYTSFIEVKN